MLDILAAEDILTPDDRAVANRVVVADNDDEIRAAVRDVLIENLADEAKTIAKNHDPLILYGATEAVSLLLRRAIPAKESLEGFAGIFFTGPSISLFADGSARVRPSQSFAPFRAAQPIAISAQTMATEIARFTDLWESRGETRLPSGQAAELARWIFLAARDHRRLLRHFEVTLPVLRPRFRAAYGLTLRPLAASERVDEPYERWRPEKAAADKIWFALPHEFLKLNFPPSVPQMGYAVCAFNASTLADVSRYRDLVTVMGSIEGGIAFVADETLLQRVRPLAAQVGQSVVTPGGSDIAAFQPEFVGVVEDITFTASDVALSAARTTIRVGAQRILLPFDLE